MSNAPKRTRTKKTSDIAEETHIPELDTKPVMRKKVSISETNKVSKPLHQRFPMIRNKPFQGELLINDEDLKKIWVHIKTR